MAVSLAQAGAVVAVTSYSLYPEALASEMAGEVLAALVWTLKEIGQYGGDAGRISVVGHSAGGHLGALAVMMLAQQRQQALEAAAAAAAGDGQTGCVSGQQQQQCKDLRGQAASSCRQQQPAQQQQAEADPCQPQQQQINQQRRRPRQPLWYIPNPLALSQPLLFVGMSSVYDVGLHFEFESMRGVAGISTMARACGGAALFDAVSPAVLLKQAAAAAAAAAGRQQAAGLRPAGAQPGRFSNQQQQLQPVQWPQLPAGAAAAAAAGYSFTPVQLGSRSLQRFSKPGSGGFAVIPGSGSNLPPPQLLHGEVIPIRSGMQPPPAASTSSSTATSNSSSLCRPAASSGGTPSNGSSEQAGSTSFGDAATLLRGFSLADAAQLPPFVVMSSCSDHMVPWHEAADMTLALQACGVPAKHLIYDSYLHNDFVLDWSPAAVDAGGRGAAVGAAAELALVVPAAAAAAAGGGVAEVSRAIASGSVVSSNSSSSVYSMPAFAQDLISIVTGRVQLQFSCSKEAAVQAADESGSRSGGAAAGSSSSFRMGRWFAVQPHSRL
jgi:acetyl esterase/lipase